MKGLLIFALLCSLFLGVYYPFVSKEKQCYETNQEAYDDLGYYSSSRGWGIQDICQRRTEMLFNLEDCIQKATGSGVIARYSNSLIQGLVSFTRPVAKGLYTYKSEHNLECTDFIKYQLE